MVRIIIEKFKKAQSWLEYHIKYIGKGKYGRVLRMARKPEKEEYHKVVMITGIGIIIIGGIGFILYLIATLVAPYIAAKLALYIHI